MGFLERYRYSINPSKPWTRRDLLALQIVWVEGRHLQRRISLAGDEPGVRLADWALDVEGRVTDGVGTPSHRRPVVSSNRQT